MSVRRDAGFVLSSLQAGKICLQGSVKLVYQSSTFCPFQNWKVLGLGQNMKYTTSPVLNSAGNSTAYFKFSISHPANPAWEKKSDRASAVFRKRMLPLDTASDSSNGEQGSTVHPGRYSGDTCLFRMYCITTSMSFWENGQDCPKRRALLQRQEVFISLQAGRIFHLFLSRYFSIKGNTLTRKDFYFT